MNKERIKAVMNKDLNEFRQSKFLWYSIIILPIFMSVLFMVSFLLPVIMASPEEMSEAPFIPAGAEDNPALMIEYMMATILPMFLVIPLMVSSMLGAHSFVSEKTNKTLESLLATPITDRELFAGKILSILTPTLIMTYIGFIVSMIITNILVYSILQIIYVPSITWLIGLVIIMPLISFMSINFTILISSRVSDQRTAQQLTGLIVLPLVGLMVLNIMGVVMINVESMMTMTAILALITYALYKASVKIFNREEILTKWT